MNSGKQLLFEVTISELYVPRSKLVVGHVNDSLGSAFDKLISNRILSIPVFDENELFHSFVDILDIVKFALSILQTSGDVDVSQSDTFKNMKIKDVPYISRYNPLHSLMKTDNLSKAINTMVNFWNIQRLPVLDSQGNLEGVLTQSQVVQYLASHIDKFPVRNKTIGDLHYVGFKRLHTIPESALVKDAFIRMRDEQLLGLAVVDNNGKLSGNISASDIKVIGLDATLISKLNNSIANIIGLTQNKLKPVTVSPHLSIHDVFKKFSDEKVHRMYVEERKELAGCIQMTDILDIVIQYS